MILDFYVFSFIISSFKKSVQHSLKNFRPQMFFPQKKSSIIAAEQKRLSLQTKNLHKRIDDSPYSRKILSPSYLNDPYRQKQLFPRNVSRSHSANLRQEFKKFKNQQATNCSKYLQKESSFKSKHKSLSHSNSTPNIHTKEIGTHHYGFNRDRIVNKSDHIRQFNNRCSEKQRPELKISEYRKNLNRTGLGEGENKHKYLDLKSGKDRNGTKLNKSTLHSGAKDLFSHHHRNYIAGQVQFQEQNLKKQLNLQSKAKTISPHFDIENEEDYNFDTFRNGAIANEPNSMKKLQESNVGKQTQSQNILLNDSLDKFQDLCQVLEWQNQELRRQREADLEVISRQQKIIRSQEDLILSLRQSLEAEKTNGQIQKEEFSELLHQMNDQNMRSFNKSALDCKQCNNSKLPLNFGLRQNSNKSHLLSEHYEKLKAEKLEEERSLLKKQIHELVYKCEDYKNQIKKEQLKLEKEKEHNEKLTKLIYESTPSEANALEKHPKNSTEYFQQRPILTSTMKPGQKHYDERDVSVSMTKNEPKLSTSKSASLINNLFAPKKGDPSEQQSSNSNSRPQGSLKSELDWCQNQNIRKYMERINREKKQEIDHIQNLLSEN